jgi:hypothetical protein
MPGEVHQIASLHRAGLDLGLPTGWAWKQCPCFVNVPDPTLTYETL